MTIVRVVVWAFIAIVLSITGYIGFLNRASERVATNLPIALAVGALGTLLTILFNLATEDVAVNFPIEYVVDPTTLLPYSCAFFPEMNYYADAGWGVGGMSGLAIASQLS